MGGIQTKLRGSIEFHVNDYEFRWEGNASGSVSRNKNNQDDDDGSMIGGRCPKPKPVRDSSRRSVSMQQMAPQRSESVIKCDDESLTSLTSLSSLALAPLVKAKYPCPICGEDYRRPIKMLPCGHSFCYRCLYEMQIPPPFPIVFKCAVCNASATVDDYRHGLPTNVDLERVLGELGIDQYETESMHFKTVSLPSDMTDQGSEGSITARMRMLDDAGAAHWVDYMHQVSEGEYELIRRRPRLGNMGEQGDQESAVSYYRNNIPSTDARRQYSASMKKLAYSSDL